MVTLSSCAAADAADRKTKPTKQQAQSEPFFLNAIRFPASVIHTAYLLRKNHSSNL
jgi:hypothetical protein